LNLFALPSLTTLLFALIAGVILTAVVVGLRQNLSALGLMIFAGMIVLPLRDFLHRPERDMHSLGLPRTKADPPPPLLVQEVKAAAGDLGLNRPPCLLITPQSVAPATTGSWRRRYLILGRRQAACLTELPASTQRALWLHEVAHFASGDSWKVGLSRSLLWVSVVFMAWSTCFLLAVVLLAFVYGLEVFEPGYLDTLPVDPALHDLLATIWPDPASTASLLEKAKDINPDLATLYVVNAHLPFVVSGVVLLLCVWRRLVQVREFYADARAATQIGNAKMTRSALVHAATALALVPAVTRGRFRDRLANLRQWFNQVMPFHPSWKVRLACLKDPLQAYGSWAWAGITAGLTVLLLDLIMVGPFTLSYVGDWPAHFATLTGFVILALWLLPGVCQGFISTGRMARQIARATMVFSGLRAVWLVLNAALLLILLILDPGQVSELLNIIILLGNKVLVLPSSLPLAEDPVALALWAIGGALGFTALVLVSQLACLLIAGFLLRRVLTWYAFPAADRRLIRVAWSVILVLALVVGLVVLPLPTAIIQGDLASFLQPIRLITAGTGILVAGVWGLWFFSTDRRYNQQCPVCSEKISGWFKLGKKCPACGETLHPWLMANY